MRKRWFSFLLSILMLTSVLAFPTMAAGKFKDVGSGVWYESFVNYVSENGLMTGTGTDTFTPKRSVTRAELVTTLYAMAGKPRVVRFTYFEDLYQEWYKDPVVWATNAGVTQGFDYKTFGSTANVTREQVATFLRAYNENVDMRNTVTDRRLTGYKDRGSVSSWAEDSVKWAVDRGLIKSTDTKEMLLSPKKPITRAELAVMLTNYSKLTYPEPKEAGQQLYPEILRDLAGRSFVFASGAGAWGNVLTLNGDGTFEGAYHDTDMLEGKGFDATQAFCVYSGRFYVKEKVDDTTYVLGLTDLQMEYTPGESFIEDRILLEATAPYGLENAGDIFLYLPGTRTADLSEEYKSWDRGAAESETLTACGLYNVNPRYGWYESEDEF